jgi:putative transport protein
MLLFTAAFNGIFDDPAVQLRSECPGLEGTIVHRGDVLTVVGSKPRVAIATETLGFADRPTDATDMVLVGLGIILGALIGLPALSIGAFEIDLSESVGVRLGGLAFGWLRSAWPVFDRIPGPTLWLFESLGLTGFIASSAFPLGPTFSQVSPRRG